MEQQKVLAITTGDACLTEEDLRYNSKLGYLMSKDEYSELLIQKEQILEQGNRLFRPLPLKTFNSKHCFYVESRCLLRLQALYYQTLVEDMQQNSTLFIDRNFSDIMQSRIFSEIEGSTNIENVPTTHQRIKKVLENPDNLTDRNDIIIKNMERAISYIVRERPDFNEANLFKLYNILSDGCLDEEDKLPDGAIYRNAPVSIQGYQGADSSCIKEMMDSLFAFVNDKNNRRAHEVMLPHICHYYILYVHPYFDYNGRTARMVSFWLSYIFDIVGSPFFLGEAINESKKDYYSAIVNTRNANNDLTYFLCYVMRSAIKFSYVYKNLEEIKKALSQKGDFLTSAESVYLKKIIIHNPCDYFNRKLFLKYTGVQMSRQSALKFLGALHEYGLLETATNKKKETVYRLNPKCLVYKFTD